jgi:hypothetical protein
MKGYTSRQQIEKYLQTTIPSSFYSQINAWIGQVEKYIDRKTDRNFIADTNATARLFDGDNTATLLINDAVAITKIEIDGEQLTTDEYYLYPANDTPKKKIVLSGRYFTKGKQNIKVTAKWGYSTIVPDDIILAATILTSGIYNSYGSTKEVKSESIGNYSVTYSDAGGWDDFANANDIVESYIKHGF